MSLLTIVQKAARRCGLVPPALVLSSGDETWLQFAEWAQEVVDDAAERHDWRALHKTQTITGNGVTSSFALASDYARLSKMPAVSRSGASASFWPSGPLSPPAWIDSTTIVSGSAWPSYQIEGATISITPAPPTGGGYTISYQSSKAIYTSTGGLPGPVASWTDDSDTVLFSERLVILGTVSRWKIAKGFDAAKFEDDYERALERLASADWGLMAVSASAPDFDLEDPVAEPYVNA